MEIWMSLVGEYGFPIAVTFYLLYRIEKKLDQLNHSVLYLGKLVEGTAIGQSGPAKVPPQDWSVMAKENHQ
ncbi:hypothetical protein J2S74_001866 [Evansella vedderi]|uniref:YvrJ family protein n=1 Tax=Evansella vedderi TaxID=38282 RepID=A0ABT9ZUT6_9BACI|nr:YvrJ family protein [Evansella vedderi]MDQ0254487.1 hypothetical protein [Evansella vedderi]